jgi:arylsulfatase A-like enzyme
LAEDGVVMTMAHVYSWLLLAVATASVHGSVKRPHIILIVADDLGWNDVAWHGSSQINTPTLTSLASSGVILDQLYVEPICSPTRASLLSGRHIAHTGIFQPLKPGTYGTLNESCNVATKTHCALLPRAMQSLGYRTHMIGKWHLGYWNWLQTPQQRGFDTYYGYLNGEGDYFLHTRSGGYDFWDGNDVDFSANTSYSTDLFTRRAVSIVSEHNASDGEHPLFMYVAWQAMHIPLQAPKDCVAPYESSIAESDRRIVAGMVSCMDAGVAQIVAALRANARMFESTTIVFLTDNGGPVTLGDMRRGDINDVYRSNYASNMPLRGQKTTYWEGGVRSAAFVSGVGVSAAAAGARSNKLIHVTDLYFSLLAHATHGVGRHSVGGGEHATAQEELAGLLADQPPFVLGDGIEQWQTIVLDPTRPDPSVDPRTETLHVVHVDSEAGPGVLRVGRLKLFAANDSWAGKNAVWYPTVGQSFARNNFTVRCAVPPPSGPGGNASFPTPPGVGQRGYCDPGIAPCLFDVVADPCEQINLATERAEDVARLLRRLDEYRAFARTDRSASARKLPKRCLPGANNATWRPCYGSPK